MFASISVYDDSNLIDKVDIDYIDNRYNFSYVDNQNNKCEFNICHKGLVFKKEAKDYHLLLHLLDEPYILINSSEGEIKLNAKVVDYYINDDILEMHYLVDGDRKSIVINYRS